MHIGQQTTIPTTLYRGVPTSSALTVELDDRFDYIITHVYADFATGGAGAGRLFIQDESGVVLWSFAYSGPGDATNISSTDLWIVLAQPTHVVVNGPASDCNWSIDGLLVVPQAADLVPPPT